MKSIIPVTKFLLNFNKAVFLQLIFISLSLSLIELSIASIIIQLFSEDQSSFIERIGVLYVIVLALFLQVLAIILFWYLLKQIMIFTYNISSLVFNNFLKNSLTFFEANKDSGMNNDVYNETNRLALNIFSPFVEIVSKSIILISISSLLFYNYGFVTIILSVGILLIYFILGITVKSKLQKIGTSVSYYNEERLKIINEAIRNILELKANNYTENISEKYSITNQQFSVVQARNQFLIKFPKYILEIILIISICFVVVFWGKDTLVKYISLGVISLKLIPQFQTLYQNWGQFNTHFIAFEKVSKFLEKNPKGGMHHICFEVEKITETINSLKNKNINILGDGNPKIGAHDKPVVFLHPNDLSGTLVELEET